VVKEIDENAPTTEQNSTAEVCLYCGPDTVNCKACGGGKMAETNSSFFSFMPGLDEIFGKPKEPATKPGEGSLY